MKPQNQTVSGRLDLAIQEQWEDIKQHPVSPNWALCRRNQSWIVAETMLHAGDHSAAAQAAKELAAESSDQWQGCYDAACLLAHCVSLALKDDRLSERDRAKLARSYASQAVKFLRSAVHKGFHEFTRLARDPDLKPIRSHGGFTSLVSTARDSQGE